jgi:hypothetical protein
MAMLTAKIAVAPDTNWLEEYKATNAGRLQAEPEFEAWLKTDYLPIAGGWQY